MRRQTTTSGVNPAGSSRDLRLDPLSLPVSFAARDSRADGGVRQIELHRERVILRRAVHGMRMAINVRVSEFIGVAVRDTAEGRALVLLHRDPSLAIPLLVTEDAGERAAARQIWSEILALPQLADDKRDPAPRRRRSNAIRERRPSFLVRRRSGDLLNPAAIYRGEHEIIARN
ncbi:DUF6101 family protein [Nitrobacter sp. JJSN]|uniref:DUF6101 family protein n=1 Tax=Nitrobacter sp. JJSN TaxID=3453033 RepID=UPI003F75C0D4